MTGDLGMARTQDPHKRPAPSALWGTVALAFCLWAATFALPWGLFWTKITLSAACLAFLSLRLNPRRLPRFDRRAVMLGLIGAVLLYILFWAGRHISTALFPFAGRQIGGIYGKGAGTPHWIIFLLLFCVTGPCEEIYWRGFLQQGFMQRYGRGRGWLLATLMYAAVHISSLNFMLVGAAGVAGAFWGAMYWRLGNLVPVIVSHSLWSAVIFTLFPVA